jgi:hypothetical protein
MMVRCSTLGEGYEESPRRVRRYGARYGPDDRDASWRRFTAAHAQAIFATLGLSGDFWVLSRPEGRLLRLRVLSRPEGRLLQFRVGCYNLGGCCLS